MFYNHYVHFLMFPSSLQVLCGCISSIEEHGYVADLGVTGIVAFLKKKEAKDYIEDYNDGKCRIIFFKDLYPVSYKL